MSQESPQYGKRRQVSLGRYDISNKIPMAIDHRFLPGISFPFWVGGALVIPCLLYSLGVIKLWWIGGLIFGPLAFLTTLLGFLRWKHFRNIYRRVSTSSREAMDLYEEASAMIVSKDFAQALLSCDKAVAVDSNFAAAYNSAGICHLCLGDRDAGEGCFRKALELVPEYPEAQRSLAGCLAGLSPLNDRNFLGSGGP